MRKTTLGLAATLWLTFASCTGSTGGSFGESAKMAGLNIGDLNGGDIGNSDSDAALLSVHWS